MTQAVFAPLFTPFGLRRKFFLQTMNPIAYTPPIGFQLCFARSTATNSARQSRERGILSQHQPWQNVFQLRQFDLDFSFV